MRNLLKNKFNYGTPVARKDGVAGYKEGVDSQDTCWVFDGGQYRWYAGFQFGYTLCTFPRVPAVVVSGNAGQAEGWRQSDPI